MGKQKSHTRDHSGKGETMASRKSSNDDIPTWRRNLLQVPEDKRCRSQRDLARSLDLIDLQLSLFKGTQPPQNFKDDPAFRALLATFEIEFLKFHMNTAITLYPAGGYPDILPWIGARQGSTASYLQMLQQTKADSAIGPAVLPSVLSFAMEHLFLHYVCVSSSDSTSGYPFAAFAAFWDGWQRRWDEMEKAAGDEILKKAGCGLTINDFRLFSTGVTICMRAFDARQKKNPEAAIAVWQNLIKWAENALSGPVLKPGCSFWWFFTAKVMNTLETEIGAVTFEDRWRISAQSDLRL